NWLFSHQCRRSVSLALDSAASERQEKVRTSTMHPQKIQELAARLEQAHTLSQMQRTALLREIERYAAQDLYGAARLCKDHLNDKADLRLFLSIQVAPLLAKHFEMRMQEQRHAIDLYQE